MSKPRKKLRGRPTTDERGNSTWKWVGETETAVETERVKALGEGLSLEPPAQKVVVDPYNQPQGNARTKGRSLDDMRRLDQEMKREHEALVKSLRQPTARKSDLPPTRRMRLQFDDRELLVDERHSSITIGRAEDNDVVVTRERVSRVHVRIDLSRNKFVLVDKSTNGTFVQSADGEESFIRRGSLQLKGQGMIGLGRRPRQGSAHTIRFTCEEV